MDIGAQVVGRIAKLGEDPRGESDPQYKDKSLDYCSTVEKGMVLAIDRSGGLSGAVQSVARGARTCEADLLQMEAKATQTEAEWERAQNCVC